VTPTDLHQRTNHNTNLIVEEALTLNVDMHSAAAPPDSTRLIVRTVVSRGLPLLAKPAKTCDPMNAAAAALRFEVQRMP
jgi:hypothetical protein